MKITNLKKAILGLLISTSVYAGGGMDGGGGQFYQPKNSKKLKFLDLKEGEINAVTLTQDKVEEILVDGYSCTKRHSIPLKEKKDLYRYRTSATERIRSLSASIPLLKPMLEMFRENIVFHLTAFPLPQLKDADRFEADIQMQAAYFENGIIYIQIQAIERLENPYELSALIIKEGIRLVDQLEKLNLTNREMEDSARKLFKGSVEDIRESSFILALKRSKEEYERKKQIIREEIAKDEKERELIKKKFIELEKIGYPDNLLEVAQLNTRLAIISNRELKRKLLGSWDSDFTVALTIRLVNSFIALGYFPGFIEETTGTKLKDVQIGGEAPTGHVWNILTGELSFNPFRVGCFN